MLVELSAGKLMFAEILSVLADRLTAIPAEAPRASVLERFKHLDEEQLILWKRTHAPTSTQRRSALSPESSTAVESQ